MAQSRRGFVQLQGQRPLLLVYWCCRKVLVCCDIDPSRQAVAANNGISTNVNPTTSLHSPEQPRALYRLLI